MNPLDPFGLVGHVLDGQFRVEKLVGEGGFSAVYRGHHLGLDEPVAIKCLKLPPALGVQLVDSFVQRFRDESRILYRLSQGNLHIVRSIGAGATTSPSAGFVVPYMVLEWLEGRSMANDFTVRKTLGKKGRTLDEVHALFATAADALGFAHAQGVVHRDLNPGNLFLAKTPQGEKMKVLDFGVAKILDDTTLNLGPRAQTMGQIRIFAPAYGSPEQFDDAIGAVGAHSDVYSFSLVLLEALRDRPVNDGTNLGEFATAAVDSSKRPTPRSLGLNLPDAVEQVFVRATKLSPKDRFANVGEMWKAFETAVTSEKKNDKPGSPGGARPGAPAPGAAPLSRTMPLGSPNLNLPRPSPGLPSKAGAPGGAGAAGSTTSKVKPAEPALGASAPGASPPAPGAGPSTQRSSGANLPAPPPRAGAPGAPGAAKPAAAAAPLAAPPAPQRAPSEPPLHEDEELPTRVGQSPLMDMPSEPPKELPRLDDGEEDDGEEEEDVTRVRAPEEDLLLAAAAAAQQQQAGANGPNAFPTPPPAMGAPPDRPAPPDAVPSSFSGTLMMAPGSPNVPLPPPGAFAPSAGYGHHSQEQGGQQGAQPHGGFGSTVAFGQSSPFAPPLQPGMQGGPMQQHSSMQPMQPMHSAPNPGGDWQQQPPRPPQGDWQQQQQYAQHQQHQHHRQPGAPGNPVVEGGSGISRPTVPQPLQAPAHFATPMAPPQFQGQGYPTGSHPQPGFGHAVPAAAQGGGKMPIGLIIAAVAFLVIGVGGVAIFLVMGRSTGTSTDPTAASASISASPIPVPVPTPVLTAPPAVDTGGGAATAQPVNDTTDAGAGVSANTAATANPNPTPTANTNPTATPTGNTNPTATANNNPTPTPPTATTATAKPTPTAAPVDPNAWNESAARSRLAQANGVLVFCRKPDDPTGPGSASVTFAPEGNVASVVLDPPYAGTKAGDCVVGQFKRAKVNPFQGSSQTIKHSFEVPK